ncbi:hypothetical protein ACHAWF_015830 [Thalassiosira exigua]
MGRLSAVSASSLALLVLLRLRQSYDRRPNFGGFSLPKQQWHRRRLSFFKASSDPRTVDLKDDSATPNADGSALEQALPPLYVCGRKAPIRNDLDLQISQKYDGCPALSRPPGKTTILLLEGVETFGRTGNNLIEFLHALQYAKDNDVVVAIVMGSWSTHLITTMWMSVRGKAEEYRMEWRELMERSFCVKILDDPADAELYEDVVRMETRELFMYQHHGLLNQYVEFQGSIIRTLYRHINDGPGVNMRQKQVKNMCSVIDAMFNEEKDLANYSVIHSRSLEGEPGKRLLGRISRNIGCDPLAALDMEPEYIKAILGPLGMLNHPIIFITDHQRPEILEKLMADPEIGPMIHLIPEEASWVGGDITAAVMSDVFIGNPASSFSGFIAKSRVALGYNNNFLFRKKKTNGEWVDVCDERCIFDVRVMNAMA